MKIKSFFLVTAMLFGMTSIFAQDCDKSGTAGPLQWCLKSGTLTISGTGAMPDYDTVFIPNDDGTFYVMTSAPWGKYSITTVVIERGIANIGKFAFFYCQAINSIDIPSSVTKIGENAFYYCHFLKSVVLPYGVTTLDELAFAGCGLVSITLPSSIKSIGDGALSCYDLTTVTNLNPVPLTIGSTVFYGDLSKCTLQVPLQSVAAYQRAEVWKEFNIVGIEVDVEELRVESGELRVYPNPATGSCNIGMPDEFLYESVLTLSVYDASGKLVRQTTLDNNGETPQLQMGLEAKGMYMVVLSNGKKEYRGKVVFQ